MTIEFGIPLLDRLFGRHPGDPIGISADSGESVSLCLVGADGTGKSVLALHLASRYASFNKARVIYFSEDLGLTRANRVFESFGLDEPTARCTQLKIGLGDCILDHVRLTPLDLNQLPQLGEVGFLDLQARTSGDDWTLLLEFIAQFPRPTTPEHLDCLIIDNVDALQLVNAGVDQFGEERSRWSRLDQLMNLAKGRCHLVLLSGEPGPNHVHDEQYAVDYVLHLRSSERAAGYIRRTMEVEKARGQVNTGGPHAFVFRSGEGTTTGYQENPDFRTVELPTGAGGATSPRPARLLSYVRVFPSLDLVYSDYMGQKHQGYVPGTGEGVQFHVLDRLNDLLPEGKVPGGAVAAIIGPRETYKGELLASFEAGALRGVLSGAASGQGAWPDIRRLAHDLQEAENQGRPVDELERLYRAYKEAAREEIRASNSPMVVHLTTEDVESWQVAYRIARWISPDPKEVFEKSDNSGTLGAMNKEALAPIEARLICRRFEVHANSPAVLYSVIADCVEEGILLATGLRSEELRTASSRQMAGRVLVTIGDWSQIEERQPEIAADTKFLPLLIFHLKRQGVTAMITESRADSSALPSVYQSHSRLSQDADQTIYTWRVLGDSRVAIATVPQKPLEGRTLVREVRADASRPGKVDVDASLERYQGFESGNPRPVKLHLRLLGQTPAQAAYARDMATLLEGLSEGEQEAGPLVEATEELEYELLRDVTYLMGDSRLSHTHLVMLDEFWEAPHSLQPLSDYLDGRPEGNPVKRFFKTDRRQSFQSAFGGLPGHSPVAGQKSDPFVLQQREDRVPYTWDFGFLLARPDAWRKAYNRKVPDASTAGRRGDAPHAGESCSIRAIAELLRFGKGQDELGRYETDAWRASEAGLYGRGPRGDELEANGISSERDLLGWRVFLEACSVVARDSGDRTLRPFDVDLTARETLTTTVLEIWFSEIRSLALQLRVGRHARSAPGAAGPKNRRGGPAQQLAELEQRVQNALAGRANRLSLSELLTSRCAVVALYFALRLLAEVFDPEMLETTDGGFDIAPRRPFPAVAVRHWYATSVRAVHEDDVPGYVAARLPGYVSTRGDWHLGVARGSRSIRLAHDALDKLASPRANFDRLQKGVGLPTQALPSPDYIRTALAPVARPTALPNCTYMNLASIGSTGDPAFQWLFRSQLDRYRFHATPFRKWIFRVLRRWVDERCRCLSDWQNSFRAYDRAVWGGPLDLARLAGELPDYEEFNRWVTSLRTLLDDAGR